MQTGQLSLIIPCRDMAAYLETLLNSVLSSGLINQLAEIIVVDDGSENLEATKGVSKNFETKLRNGGFKQSFKLIPLIENEGRYVARLRGAETATSEFILFLDCRVRLESDLVIGLKKHFPKEPVLIGVVHIDENASIFNLYWKRTHERLFRKSIPKEGEFHYITHDNFADHVVGTGVFLLPKKDFLEVCRVFGNVKLESDDTLLLAELVKTKKIFRSYDIGVYWEPRQELVAFLKHLLIHRGLTFAEYHVLQRGSHFALIFYAGLIAFLIWLGICFVQPSLGLALLAVLCVLVLLSISIFTRSFREVLVLGPLHLLVIAGYGFGILGGIARLWMRKLKARIRVARS